MVCTAPALSLLIVYTTLGTSTVLVISYCLIAKSKAISIPVLPVPGLQCTTIGPEPPLCNALDSNSTDTNATESDGVAVDGHKYQT